MMKEVYFSEYCWKCKHADSNEDAEVCSECLGMPYNEDSHKPIKFIESSGHPKLPYKDLVKLRDFVYTIEYENLDYEFAKRYYKSQEPSIPVGACSAVRAGNFVGRNLDWTYDDLAEFVVRTPAKNSRHAVIGVSSGLPKLTDSFVSGRAYDDIYGIVPFQLYDGVNDAGVTASILVVPADKGTGPSVPLVSKREEINGLMLVRYILDKFASAREALEYIADYVSVWFSSKYTEQFGYILHYFVADTENTYCLEFVNGSAVILDLKNAPYVTNFYLTGVTLNEDGTVYTPYTKDDTHDAMRTNGVTENGSGLERYNMLCKVHGSLTGYEDVRELLPKLYYTNAYRLTTEPSDIWYTEFVGDGLTPASDANEFTNRLIAAAKAFLERNRRSKKTWQTVHSVIYDVEKKSLAIRFQEDPKMEYGFKL